MALTPTESQQLATLLSKVTNIEGVNTDLLTLIRSAGQGGAVDIAAHNNNAEAHAALFGTKIRTRTAAYLSFYIDPAGGNDANNGISAATAVKSWAALTNLIHSFDGCGQSVLHLFLAPGDYDGNLVLHGNSLVVDTRIMCSTPGGQINFNGDLTFYNGIFYMNNAVFNFVGTTPYSLLRTENTVLRIGDWNATTLKMSGSSNYGIILENTYAYFRPALTWDANGLSTNTVLAMNKSSLQINVVEMTGAASGRKYSLRMGSTLDTQGLGPFAIPGSIDGITDITSGAI